MNRDYNWGCQMASQNGKVYLQLFFDDPNQRLFCWPGNRNQINTGIKFCQIKRKDVASLPHEPTFCLYGSPHHIHYVKFQFQRFLCHIFHKVGACRGIGKNQNMSTIFKVMDARWLQNFFQSTVCIYLSKTPGVAGVNLKSKNQH